MRMNSKTSVQLSVFALTEVLYGISRPLRGCHGINKLKHQQVSLVASYVFRSFSIKVYVFQHAIFDITYSTLAMRGDRRMDYATCWYGQEKKLRSGKEGSINPNDEASQLV